jgi:hypothetical protein
MAPDKIRTSNVEKTYGRGNGFVLSPGKPVLSWSELPETFNLQWSLRLLVIVDLYQERAVFQSHASHQDVGRAD